MLLQKVFLFIGVTLLPVTEILSFIVLLSCFTDSTNVVYYIVDSKMKAKKSHKQTY